MSQTANCRNTRKSTARQRELQLAKIKETVSASAVDSLSDKTNEAICPTMKIDRKKCSDKEEVLLKNFMTANKEVNQSGRHSKIVGAHRNKIINRMFLNGTDYEANRLKQEPQSAVSLKRKLESGTEPPPVHCSHGVVTPRTSSSCTTKQSSSQTIGTVLLDANDKSIEQREREKERLSTPGPGSPHSYGSLVPVISTPTGRILQEATPPHASQVPSQADSLQRYPVMWQGLLTLKSDQAAVQFHYVSGDRNVARDSLPCNNDGSTPPLQIMQLLPLEVPQLELADRKMQIVNEHCVLLALPCGRDHMDFLQQSTNLRNDFITYLLQKQAAGVVNIMAPDNRRVAYVVYAFPSCEYADEILSRIAPDLMYRSAHLLIVIVVV